MRKTLFLVCAALLVALAAPAWSDDLRVSREWFSEHMGAPNVMILDVRQPFDYNSSPNKIKGAQRREPAQVHEWVKKLDKDKTYLLYCS